MPELTGILHIALISFQAMTNVIASLCMIQAQQCQNLAMLNLVRLCETTAQKLQDWLCSLLMLTCVLRVSCGLHVITMLLSAESVSGGNSQQEYVYYAEYV